MRKKYLFFDMDRTLISPSNRKIPQSAIDGIRQARANGHEVFLCTGRSLSLASEYFDVLDVDGVVFSNGGGIAYRGKILETRDIPFQHVERIQDICTKLGAGFQFLTPSYTYQSPIQRERFKKHFVEDERGMTVEECLMKRGMKTLAEYQGETVQKIDISCVDELVADVCFASIPQSLSLILAGGYFAGMGRTGGEITAEGVDKGSGVRRVMDLFGADLYDTYGFGDSGNDIAMLTTCHTGICMGNGDEEVKRCADYVTGDCDHDGIYQALKHFELI